MDVNGIEYVNKHDFQKITEWGYDGDKVPDRKRTFWRLKKKNENKSITISGITYIEKKLIEPYLSQYYFKIEKNKVG